MTEIDERPRETERELRRELEEKSRELTRLRMEMTTMAERLVREERERITLELDDRTELTQREIGEVVCQSQAWVSQTLNRDRERDRDRDRRVDDLEDVDAEEVLADLEGSG